MTKNIEHITNKEEDFSRRNFLRTAGSGLVAAVTAPLITSLSSTEAEAARVIQPRNAYRIISDYGSWTGVNGGSRSRQHQGIDWGAPRGTPVLAAADGLIEFAHDVTSRGYGGGKGIKLWNTTHPDSGYQFFHWYLHLDSFDPEIKRRIDNGEQYFFIPRGKEIGKVGSTGTGSGGVNHLHFEFVKRPRGTRGGRHYVRVNPHKYWVDGPGRVTLFDKSKSYNPGLLTMPLPPK